MSDQNLNAPNLEAPNLSQPEPITGMESSVGAQLAMPDVQSINLFTRLELVPDVAAWIVIVGILLMVAHHMFRRAVDQNQSPRAAYVLWNSLFFILSGMFGFIFLLPHSGENAASLGDLFAKINWLWMLVGALVVAGGCILSTLNRVAAPVEHEVN